MLAAPCVSHGSFQESAANKLVDLGFLLGWGHVWSVPPGSHFLAENGNAGWLLRVVVVGVRLNVDAAVLVDMALL